MIKDIYRNIYNKGPEAYSEHSQDFKKNLLQKN